MLTWQKMPYRSLISLLRARSRLQSDPERHQKPKVKLPLTFVIIDKIAYRRAQLCHFWGYCFWLITNQVILSSRILSLFGFTIAFQCFLNASARVPFGPEVLYWWYAKTVQCFKLTLKILSGRRSTNKCETFICTWWVLKTAFHLFSSSKKPYSERYPAVTFLLLLLLFIVSMLTKKLVHLKGLHAFLFGNSRMEKVGCQNQNWIINANAVRS